MENSTVIFTFGTNEKFPFWGGWVQISAPSRRVCLKIFKALYPHPEDPKGTLNCAFYYDLDDFLESDMAKTGNFGKFCHKKWELVEV